MALEIHETPESPLDLALKQHRWLGLVVSMKWSRAAVQVFLHEQSATSLRVTLQALWFDRLDDQLQLTSDAIKIS